MLTVEFADIPGVHVETLLHIIKIY